MDIKRFPPKYILPLAGAAVGSVVAATVAGAGGWQGYVFPIIGVCVGLAANLLVWRR